MDWPEAQTLLAPLAPWFERAKRAMPWRARDLDGPHPDPYAVIVSELMLQQTQVATVIPYFERWMARFPTPHALAQAEEQSVHKAWEGLGYYRRCRFLKAAASEIAVQGWPTDLEGLQALPGLGPYTAAAVGAIAFQWLTPALDGNAFRVLSRLLLIEGDPKREAAALREWLAPALEAHGPSRMTQAIMELGAAVCLPTPKCEACPLAGSCSAHVKGKTADIPPVAKRGAVKEEDLWLMAVESEDAFLLHEPAQSGLLAGLWRWPVVEMKATPDLAAEPMEGYSTLEVVSWKGWTQVYSHRKERVSPIHVSLEERFPAPKGMAWVPRFELNGLPLGRRDAKLRDLLKTEGQAMVGLPFDPLRCFK